MVPVDPDRVVAGLARVRQRIEAVGGPPDLVVVAVTKGFGPDAVGAALRAGLADVGENYAQELVGKAPAPAVAGVVPRFHFLGQVQRNKVRQISDLVALWQSVDRREEVVEIARRSPGAEILVQLDLSGGGHRGGCEPGDAPGLVRMGQDSGLVVSGLMGVGRAGHPELARDGFRRLVSMADDLGLGVRSIGMSADLEVAVEEGSTMVRIGRELFGERLARG